MKKASRIRIRMSEDGAPRVSLAEGKTTKKATRTKVVSFNKGRAEPASAAPAKSSRIRVRVR